MSEGGVEVGEIAKRLHDADGTRLQEYHLQVAMMWRVLSGSRATQGTRKAFACMNRLSDLIGLLNVVSFISAPHSIENNGKRSETLN